MSASQKLSRNLPLKSYIGIRNRLSKPCESTRYKKSPDRNSNLVYCHSERRQARRISETQLSLLSTHALYAMVLGILRCAQNDSLLRYIRQDDQASLSLHPCYNRHNQSLKPFIFVHLGCPHIHIGDLSHEIVDI